MRNRPQPSALKPCRKKISGKAVKKALAAFVGTCGAAAVMSAALNSTPLSAQAVPGEMPAIRLPATSSATSQPTAKPATTKPNNITSLPAGAKGGAFYQKIQDGSPTKENT